MKQWTPATVPPEEGRVLLLCLTSSLSSVRDLVVARFVSGRMNVKHGVYLTAHAAYAPEDFRLFGWMYTDDLADSPRGYDPAFGDDRLCKCGHSYYRHFDIDHAPVGCKYCHGYAEGISHRMEVPLTEGVNMDDFTESDWETYRHNMSICMGFELADGQPN